jgi:hypothetical protein
MEAGQRSGQPTSQMLWELSVAEQGYRPCWSRRWRSGVQGCWSVAGVSRGSIPCPAVPELGGPGVWPRASAKFAGHVWQILGVVGASSWAHHVTMNEFADQGHRPPDDPRALVPASPAPPPRPPDPPGDIVGSTVDRDLQSGRGRSEPFDDPGMRAATARLSLYAVSPRALIVSV